MTVQSEVSSQLREWQATFKRELTAHLSTLRTDADIFGYALEVPEDLGSLHLITAIGRESKLAGEEPDSEYWISRRYSPVEWDGYVHDSTVYAESNAGLESMQSQFANAFCNDDCTYTRLGNRFQRSLHNACFDAMAQCDAEGAFGSIWFKIIVLSDGDAPVIRKSFNRLNRGRARKEAHLLYNGPGVVQNLRNFVWAVYARQVRRRRSRRKAKQSR